MAVADLPGRSGPGRRRAIEPRHLTIHLAIFVGLIALWEYVTWAGIADPLISPRPSAVVEAFWRIYVVQANIWYHLYITMTEVLVGFFAGSILGVGLAVVVGSSSVMREYLKPYIIVLEATPRIAVGPLIIAWLGFGWSSKIGIVMLVCFFAPFINTLTGMMNVDGDKLQMFRAMRASRWQIFTKLMLPDAMPVIMAGLRLAMAAALGGALVAEFISANEGMGVLLNRYTASLNMSSSFACLLTLTALGFVIFRSMEAVDNRIVFWRREDRTAQVSARRAAAWARQYGSAPEALSREAGR